MTWGGNDGIEEYSTEDTTVHENECFAFPFKNGCMGWHGNFSDLYYL